ncbi:polysaccharide pyruvyl transferase [Geobacter sp. OR-1]|nr:polysaccharide pyruvyl transferase [Geobacter sp. OR-1]
MSCFEEAAARISDLNACDFILLGGGGLILRNTGRFASLFERLTPRFGCVGISIEAKHADNMQILEVLKQRAEFILVRDFRSRELLDFHFKTIVGPDLTFLYPFDVVTVADEDACGLNLRPWRFWPGEHNGMFDRTMRRLNRQISNLDRLFPFSKWDQKGTVNILRQKFKSVYPIPLYFEPGVENDRDIMSGLFHDVPTGFSDDCFLSCRFIVGMRLHSLIFACQTGIPFLSLTYQPKNDAFCRELGKPELSCDIFKPELLETGIDNIKNNHARIRSELLDARETCQQEITAIMTAIRRLVVR